MALPNNKTEKPSEKTPVKATGPVFEDVVERMPGASAINSETNPYQEAVNKLAQDPRGHQGNAIPVIIDPTPTDDDQDPVTTARALIRRAANNVGKGAKTKVATITSGEYLGMVRIYFTIGNKVERKTGQN